MKAENNPMRMRALACVLILIAWSTVIAGCAADSASAEVCCVRHRGDRRDGHTVYTTAIQKALDECGNTGGGTVRFPSGTYLSKPIIIHTKTTLQLDEGAKLQATGEQAAFLKSGTNWLEAKGGGDFNPFIGGKDLVD